MMQISKGVNQLIYFAGQTIGRPIAKYADYICRMTSGNYIVAGMTSLFVAWLGLALLLWGIGSALVLQDMRSLWVSAVISTPFVIVGSVYWSLIKRGEI